MYFLIFCMGLIYICTNNLMKDSSISRIKGLILFFRGWRRLFFFFLDHALITTGWRWVYIKYKCFHCASSFHLMWYIMSDRFWFKVFQMKMQGNLGNGFWKFLPLLNPLLLKAWDWDICESGNFILYVYFHSDGETIISSISHL